MHHQGRLFVLVFILLCLMPAARSLAAAPVEDRYCATWAGSTIGTVLILVGALGLHAHRHRRRFYRKVLLSLTNHKLEICDYPTLRPYLGSAHVEARLNIPGDVRTARNAVRGYCLRQGMDEDRVLMLALAVGEAANNALKHASGGRLLVGRFRDKVWVAVVDRGNGIDSLMLPRVALQPGFSTKTSLGMGYTVMLDVADRVLLATGHQGTTVVLTQHIHNPPPR